MARRLKKVGVAPQNWLPTKRVHAFHQGSFVKVCYFVAALVAFTVASAATFPWSLAVLLVALAILGIDSPRRGRLGPLAMCGRVTGRRRSASEGGPEGEMDSPPHSREGQNFWVSKDAGPFIGTLIAMPTRGGIG
jgi:hypothetical protein